MNIVLTTLNQVWRFAWPFIVSVGLHLSLITRLFYSITPPLSKPTAAEKSMAVMLMANKPEQMSSAESPKKLELKSIPERLVSMQQLKLKPKLSPRQKGKTQPQKPVTLIAAPTFSAPVSSSTLATNNVKSVRSSVLWAINRRVIPAYPEYAKALGIEGRLTVMYDVNSEGRVENVRILSAQPRNMFERNVRLAMRRWTYKTCQPASNLTLTFQFNLGGVRVARKNNG